ncbi:hypothetical protein Hanom_Chr01g00082281 [Helianthus anomalus]
MVGELFGFVLHVPKVLHEDLDLSVFKIGVLVGEVQRIREVVSLKWKERVFRIWVEEDQDVWVPDSLKGDLGGSPTYDSPMMSSPVVDLGNSKVVEGGQSQKSAGAVSVEESPAVDVAIPDVDCRMHDKTKGNGESRHNDGAADVEVGPIHYLNIGDSRGNLHVDKSGGGAASGSIENINGSGPNPFHGCGPSNVPLGSGAPQLFPSTIGGGPYTFKSAGPLKKPKASRKTSGRIRPSQEGSGSRSGEPVLKKRKRTVERWLYPLGRNTGFECRCS